MAGRVPLTKVVDRDLDSLRREFVDDDRLDLFPFTTSKTATDAGMWTLASRFLASAASFIKHFGRHRSGSEALGLRLISVLGDHVGDPEVRLD